MAKDLTDSLRILTEQALGQTSRIDRSLPAAREAPAIPARDGGSGPVSGGAGGGGIASPLVEVDYANRTWHATRNLMTTDGLFSITIKPVKTITFKDAKNAEVVIEFKEPA